jgi:hypothetical protein
MVCCFSILRKKHGEVEDADYVAYEQSEEALRLLEMYGGIIRELLEDHPEQSHQKMDKIHERLARLGFGMKRVMAISRLAEIVNDPHLKDVQETVEAERQRKFKRTSKQGAKQMGRKKVKDECRGINLECELERVKDETFVTGHEAAKRKIVAGPSSLT